MRADYPGIYPSLSVGNVRQTTQRGGWHEYERRKADWARANPEADSQQYQAAMQRIARECEV